MNAITSINISSIKKRVRRIIGEMRSIPPSALRVKINQIELLNEDKILITGEYVYRSILGAPIESGKFEIKLDKNLEPVKISINPATRGVY